MIDVTVVFKNENEYQRILDAHLNVEPYFTFINESKEPKKAMSFKSSYSAKMSPFIVINRDFCDYDVIYREACNDPIGKMIDILNNEIRSDKNVTINSNEKEKKG